MSAATSGARHGHLVIIGGHEDREDDKLILKRFVDLSGGADARIVVLTAASTIHDEMWQVYDEAFSALGVKQHGTVKIASRDDAGDEATAARIAEADGVFMTGGDQKRLLALIGGTRIDHAMHHALRTRGACIAGTSAGASAMSEHMLFDGSNDLLPQKGTVHLGAGLGFLHRVIVDQHFSERQRLGRLLSVVAQNPYLLGAGIDEDTALIVRPGHGIEVIGEGAVTLIDGREMRSNVTEVKNRATLQLADVRLHLLPAGARYGVAADAADKPLSAGLRDAIAAVTSWPGQQGVDPRVAAHDAQSVAAEGGMKVVDRRPLRGPNIYAARPVYLAVLDLEELADVASTALPGFVDGLLQTLPTLHEHRCSPGHVGGFVERLREGTYMAHIVEHLAIELQCLAGHTVGFGRARQVRGQPRHYRVVFAYRDERVAAAALDAAIALVLELAEAGCEAQPRVPLADRLAPLRRLVERAALGPSTRAIVEAAERRGIPTLRVTEQASLFQLGWGAKQQRIQATMTSRTNHVAVVIAGDKDLTKRLLKEAGLPVPQGRTVATLEAALAAARDSAGTVAIKPLNGNQGKGVTTAVQGDDAVSAAFARAQQFGRHVIVEDHIEGDDYRVLVVGNAMVAAARRVPPEVTGDGSSSVQALVALANADPRRGNSHENVLTRIRLDEAAAKELAAQGLDADAVPAAGRVVRLRGNANLSTGGTARDVTADVHPDTAAACVRAARCIGLDVAGIDLVCRDIGQPLAAQGGALIEVNAAPGIRMHEHPSEGARQHVGRAIVRSLFGAKDNGRIPLIAVTGTNGRTRTALAIAHVLQHAGSTTGVATSEGIAIDGCRVADGDCTDDWAARRLLTAPEVEVAVLETAHGDILKRGLAFDRCDVGIVLNVHGDHLGLDDGIDTVEQLAQVKGLLVATARKAAVLNADDRLCVAMAARVPRGCELVYFGFDAGQATLARHLADGGRAVYEHEGMLVWAGGGEPVPLVAAAALASTLGGAARHNVANCIAASAALLALGVPRERIGEGLASFISSERQNPMR